MDTFNELYAQLSTVPGLCDSIGMEKGMAFIRLAARLKDAIIAAQPAKHDANQAPEDIPEPIHEYLAAATELPLEFVDGCWKAFAGLAWRYDEKGKPQGTDAQAFKRHGLDDLLCQLKHLSILRLVFFS